MSRLTMDDIGKTRALASGHVQPTMANFDGSSQYLRWTTSAMADSNSFSMVTKVKRSAVGSVQHIYMNNTQRVDISFVADDNISIRTLDTAGAATFSFTRKSLVAYADTDRTMVVMIAMDNSAAVDNLLLYVDDTEVINITGASSNLAIDFTATRHDIGADAGTTAAEIFSGCMDYFWMSSEFIDWSSAGRRAAVYQSAGEVKNPGDDGRYWSPSNRQPEIFIADMLNAPGTNDGSGTNPTANGTPFTACS